MRLVCIVYLVAFMRPTPISMNYFSKQGSYIVLRAGDQEMKITASDLAFEWTLNDRLFFSKRPKVCKNDQKPSTRNFIINSKDKLLTQNLEIFNQK